MQISIYQSINQSFITPTDSTYKTHVKSYKTTTQKKITECPQQKKMAVD